MCYVSSISFRGGGCESAGSIGQKEAPNPCPDGKCVNFKGRYDGYSAPEKKTSVGKALLGTACAGMTIAGSLAYAYKSGKLSSITNETAKKWVKNLKIDPAGEKCYNCYAYVKGEGIKLWNKIKNIGK